MPKLSNVLRAARDAQMADLGLGAAIAALTGVMSHQLVREACSPVTAAAVAGLFDLFQAAPMAGPDHIVRELPCRN